MSPTQIALALVTDLSNLRAYEETPLVRAPLVLVAEERISALLEHLASVRAELDMPRYAQIIQG